MTIRSDWPLVGRDDELRFILDALADEADGAVVLVGPAGVGKTRLAAEASSAIRATGRVAAWVSASATTTEIPLGALAPMIPDLIEPAGAPTGRPGALARGARALAAAGGGRPLVLCVDDAHLLDPLSAALVRQAAATGVVGLLATVRRGERVPDDLTALWKDGRAERLEITGLSRFEVDRLVSTVLGGRLHGATLQRVWALTEGNTLFVREVVESALAAGALRRRDGFWRLDERFALGSRLVDLVALRLGTLTPAAERVIEHVALAEPIDADLVVAVTSPNDVAEAERLGAITAADDGGRLRLHLAHPLYGEVVRARIPPLRARRILDSLADALERRGVERADEMLAWAAWRVASGGECSLDMLLRAAHHARIHFDFRLAERLAHAACIRHGDLTASRARAEYLYLLGRFIDAEEVLGGVDLVGATDRQRADVAMTRAANAMWGLGDGAAAQRLLADAATTVSDPDAVDDVRALHARVALAGARLGESLELTAKVLTRAGAGELARLSAAVGREPALALAGRTGDALALLDALQPVALAHLAEFPQGIGMILNCRVTAHWFAGDLALAEQAADELYELGVAVGSWDAICTGARCRAWVELARGRPRTAMDLAAEALAAVPDGDLNGLACWCQSVAAEAAAVAGDAGAGEAVTEMAAVRHPSIRVYDAQMVLATAWAAAGTGELSRAADCFVAGSADARASGAHAVECHLLHNVARVGYPDRVAARLGELTAVVDGRWPALFADHAAALCAADADALARIAEAFAGLDAMLLAAEAGAEAARAYRRQGREASRRAAATRSAAWAAECEGARTLALAAPESVVPLTRREHEIAALAGHGLSSPEIARMLTVSTRTVEGHLQRLYAKLGVNRRQDLARHLAG